MRHLARDTVQGSAHERDKCPAYEVPVSGAERGTRSLGWRIESNGTVAKLELLVSLAKLESRRDAISAVDENEQSRERGCTVPTAIGF